MFQSARFKLTAWYVLIIMLISILFSLFIYAGVNNEFRRFERFQQLRTQREQEGIFVPLLPRRNTFIVPEELVESRKRILLVLTFINIGILVFSSGASYFLAGRTLKPIKDMVDEQNRFITDASHEFRTPLTSLRSEIEVNLRDKNITLQDAKSLLVSNLEEVINLQSLSDHLMELAQYQKKNGNSNFENLSLADIINSSVKRISQLAKKKNITISKDIKNYSVSGIRLSLEELFVILLDNAVKYSPKNKTINIVAQKNDHSAEVKVIDEGVGIDKNDIPNIFNRFFRADMSRSKNSVSGFGLGLSIAKKIVELHNGSIGVESQLHKGTTFIVKLPLYKNS